MSVVSSNSSIISTRYLEILKDQLSNKLPLAQSQEHLVQLRDDLQNLWDSNESKLRREVSRKEERNNLNALYWGKTIPENSLRFITRASLYVDRVLIRDPILEYLWFMDSIGTEFVDNAIIGERRNLLALEQWIERGLVVVLPPDADTFDEIVWKISSDVDPITEDVEGLEKEDPRRFALGSGRDEHLRKTLEQSNDLNALSYTDSFVSWKTLSQMLDDQDQRFRALCRESFVFRAVEEVSLKYLDNVPLDLALEIREKEHLQGLREFFRERFSQVRDAKDLMEFKDILADCGRSIDAEVASHEDEWKLIKKRVSAKVPLYGAISLGALSAQTIFDPFTLVGILSGTMGLDALAEFEKYRGLKSNPLHVLMRVKGH